VAWLGIVSSVLSAVAVVLLLVAPSARWFKGVPTR
jgi:hypothetical protein